MDDTRKSRRIAANLIAGLLVGGAIGAALAASGAIEQVSAWRASEIATLAIGALLLIIAGFTAFAATSGNRYRRMIDQRADDEPVEAGDLVFARRQALVSGAAGVLLIAIPAAANSGLAPEARIAAAIGVFAILAVQTLFNVRLWRDGDELTRRVVADSGAISFWLLQFALFAWAALVMLGLAPEIDSWTGVAVLMAVYLVTSTLVAMRRGFGQ